MLAPRLIPAPLRAWNRKWRVPEGLFAAEHLDGLGRGPFWRARARRTGPFVFQPNNSTRIVEYPWAFHVAPMTHGLRAVEVGGGLSGLQFVLAREGAHVTNVDPFEAYGAAGQRDPARQVALHARLNSAFRTGVELEVGTLDRARLPAESVDRIYSISVLEHLSVEALEATMAAAGRLLRPGGLMVVTLDLFLDVEPFTDVPANRYGRNASVARLVEMSGLELVWGRRAELCGYPEFAARAVLSRLARYYIGHNYPCLAQLLVLRKDGPATAASALDHELMGSPEGGPSV